MHQVPAVLFEVPENAPGAFEARFLVRDGCSKCDQVHELCAGKTVGAVRTSVQPQMATQPIARLGSLSEAEYVEYTQLKVCYA